MGSSTALLLRTGRTTTVGPPQDAGNRQSPRLSICFSLRRDTCHVRGQSLCQGLPLSKECAEAVGVKDSSPFHPGPYVLSTVSGPGNGSALGVVW